MRAAAAIGMAGVVVLAGVGGWFAASHVAREALDRTMAQLRADAGPGGSATYARAVLHPLRRGARLTQLAIHTAKGLSIVAGTLDVGGGGTTLEAASVLLTIPREQVTIDRVHVAGLLWPAQSGTTMALTPGNITFDRLDARGIAVATAFEKLRIGALRMNDYGPLRQGTLLLGSIEGSEVSPTRNIAYGMDRGVMVGRNLVATLYRMSTQGVARSDAQGYSGECDNLWVGRGAERFVQVDVLHAILVAVNAQVTRRTTDATGIRITGGPLHAWLGALGYSALKAEVHMTTIIDREKNTLDFKSLTVEAPGAGSAMLALQLANVPDLHMSDLQSVSGKAGISAMSATSLAGGRFTYTDHGLFDRVQADAAKRNGLTLDQQRAAELALLTPPDAFSTPGATVAGPLSVQRRIRDAMGEFIRRPGSITLSVSPPQPVPFLLIARQFGSNTAQLGDAISFSAQVSGP